MKKATKKEYVIVRGRDSGVHAGTLIDDGKTSGWVELADSRRLWYWVGATLDQIATDGPGVGSKIPVAMPRKRLKLADVCELITCSEQGAVAIAAWPAWKV